MAPKRPHKTLTLAEKQDILQMLYGGISGRALARKYGVGTSTISDIKRRKDKMISYISNCMSLPNMKVQSKPKYIEMEDALYQWFQYQRETNARITDTALKKKALQIHAEYYKNAHFTASGGWLSRFKRRRGIQSSKSITAEKSNNQSAFLEEFNRKVLEMDLQPSQIYIADESTLFWKSLPLDNNCLGREKINFLICTNSDGTHKLRTVVVGTETPTKDFENHSKFLIEYYPSESVCLTPELFLKWFQDSFKKELQQFQEKNNLNGKAILLIINSDCDASTLSIRNKDNEFIAMRLPDSSFILQSVEQSITSLIKLRYWRNFLTLLSFDEIDLSKVFENVLLKDSIVLLADAWNNVAPNSIKKNLNHLLSHDKNPIRDRPEDLLELEVKEESEIGDDFIEVTKMLRQIHSDFHHLSESQVMNWITDVGRDMPFNHEENSTEEVTSIKGVTKEDAVNSFDICIKWAEENRIDSNEIEILKRLRQQANEFKQESFD